MAMARTQFVILLLWGWATHASDIPATQPVCFTHVSIIPMDRERVLRDQTVVVRDGTIATIGDSATVSVPDDAMVIDGRGKYLIPGLIDMHTHLFTDEEFPDELAGDELAVMVANGVTTTRLMIGTPEHLTLRTRIGNGELVGPTLFVASPQIAGRASGRIFNGRAVKTAEEARSAVNDFKKAGYDFIKLTTDITPEVYDAVTEAAKAADIRVVGHVDPRIGVRKALEAGQQIEHLDCYMENVLGGDSTGKPSVSDYGVWRKPNWATLDDIDDQKVSELAHATGAIGGYTCPTLTFFELSFAVEQSDDQLQSRPDFRFFPKERRVPLLAAHRRFWTEPPSAERRAKYVRTRDSLVKQIHDAGGKIMAGSDSPELFLLYGFTLHREVKNLQEAGLTPYQALEAATRTPAEFLKGLDTFGTIEARKRADMVLLEANPLDDVSNTERRAGVMIRGRWIPETEAKAMLERIATKFENAS
jgi:imidazolonepropionase-like amidohydrolase